MVPTSNQWTMTMSNSIMQCPRCKSYYAGSRLRQDAEGTFYCRRCNFKPLRYVQVSPFNKNEAINVHLLQDGSNSLG